MRFSVRSVCASLLLSANLLIFSPAIQAAPETPTAAHDYSWQLAPGVTTFKLDVNQAIVGAGFYRATFQWKKGQHALQISSVALYEGEKKVAEDVHEGRAGIDNVDNSYRFELPQFRTGTQPYTLQAQVKGDGGTDSIGILTLVKTTKEYPWKLAPGVSTFTFDVNSVILQPGTYRATFNGKWAGAHSKSVR